MFNEQYNETDIYFIYTYYYYFILFAKVTTKVLVESEYFLRLLFEVKIISAGTVFRLRVKAYHGEDCI